MKVRLFIFMVGIAALMACAGDQASNLPTLSPAIDDRPISNDSALPGTVGPVPTVDSGAARSEAVTPTREPPPNSPTQTIASALSQTPATTELSPVAAEQLPPDIRVNRITYVSPDFEIFTINPNGSEPIRISPSKTALPIGRTVPRYTWPGWSPDGQRIVYSAIILPPDPGIPPFILLSTLADGSTAEDPEAVFQGQPGSAMIVAGGPHYSLWSPDSKKIASVVGIPDGGRLILFDFDQKVVVPLPHSAPVWLGWSPTSDELVVNAAESVLIYDDPFSGDSGVELGGGAVWYFAPQFAPDGEKIAFLDEQDGETFLNVHEISEAADTSIAAIDGLAWFRWSPDGGSIAVLRSDFQYESSEVWLVASDGTSEELLASGRYRMFMWSPDGSKLLLAEIDATTPSRLRWSVMDMASREISELVTFTPTLGIRQVHSFFDQFSASHTFWSPDGRSLVFAGLLHEPLPVEEDRVRGAETVWIVDVDGEPRLHALADGILAFWSPI